MQLNTEQKRVALGVAAAIVFSVLFLTLGFYLYTPDAVLKDALAPRLTYALRCDIFAVLTLFFGIAYVGNQRFFTPDAIIGGTDTKNQKLLINLRYNTNTLEQLMMAIPAHLVLATLLPIQAMHLLPLLVTLFIIGRVAFWVGYQIYPTFRAFGFAVTMYPTVGVIVYDIWRIL